MTDYWLGRFEQITPIIYLTDIHLINNLRYMKRKGLRLCRANGDKDQYWEHYIHEVYYALVEEAEKRKIDHKSILETVV